MMGGAHNQAKSLSFAAFRVQGWRQIVEYPILSTALIAKSCQPPHYSFLRGVRVLLNKVLCSTFKPQPRLDPQKKSQWHDGQRRLATGKVYKRRGRKWSLIITDKNRSQEIKCWEMRATQLCEEATPLESDSWRKHLLIKIQSLLGSPGTMIGDSMQIRWRNLKIKHSVKTVSISAGQAI